MPKVSILVPIYNVEKYLKECLDSILTQSLKDIEIICINDGSTDSCPEILEEYRNKDPRIKVINKINSGYGASMNQGLNIATGEYIGIVESDDFIRPEMFKELYNTAVKFNAEIVKSDYYNYLTSINQSRRAGIIGNRKANCITSIEQDASLIKIVPSIWSSIYNREWLQKLDIRFLETPGASYQDTSFAFKALALAKRIVLLDKAFLFYRNDNENSSVNSKNKVFAIDREFDEITSFLNNNPKIKNILNNTKLIKEYNTYIWNLKRIDKCFYNEFIKGFSLRFKTYYSNGEITKEFYKKINKKEFLDLINNQNRFTKRYSNIIKKELKIKERQKKFSIRINRTRMSIILFGKQVVELGHNG